MRPSAIVPLALFATLSSALPASPHIIRHGITNSTEAVRNGAFDYIICGGGLTGLTVASRLTEDPDIHVLVIENGYNRYDDPRVNDVRTYGQAFESDLEYAFRSTPVPWQDNGTLLLVAGKMLSGSDGLNGASWTKGAKSQYDLLKVLTGDDSWGWEELNKHMLKAENFHLPSDDEVVKGAQYDDQYHGVGGPIQVAFGAGMYAGTQLPALEAAEQVWNVTRNPDAAAGQTIGSTIIPNMVYDDDSQNRSSAYTGYVHQQIQQRDNFLILTGHRVTEIVWADSKQNGKLVADGVHFQASPDSDVEFVRAKREVLLAAGALQSPQILELSGVGDPDVLRNAGIDVRLPLKGVGKNMQEQTKNSLFYEPIASLEFDGSGPPTSVCFPTAHSLLRSSAQAWYDNTTASLAHYASLLESRSLVPNATATHHILQAQLDNLFQPPADADAAAAEVFFTIDPATRQVGADVWTLVVLSRGTAHIRSPSSWDPPVVEPSYFLHPLDLALQTAAARQTRAVFATAPLAARVARETVPGPAALPADAPDAAWRRWTRASFSSVWHYVATLSMLREELGGVVDARLRVYGVANVRAVDASVLPVQLSAHLSSSLFGIAEKAAAMIREDHRERGGGGAGVACRDRGGGR